MDRMRLGRVLRGAAAALAAMVSAVAMAGTVTYYHNDLAGSPVVATNESGTVIWRESYRPYGERTVNAPASSGNKVWFTSRRQDVETGLVYMGARYYDPVIGRFISTDTAGFDDSNLHSFNRYAYGNNNPYRFVDPDGRSATLAFCAGGPLGCAIGIGLTAATAYYGAEAIAGTARALNALNESTEKGSAPKPPDPSSGSEKDPADKSGELTKAGRAQQKHGDRSGSAFGKATGTPEDKNTQGQETLGSIVGSPNRADEPNRIGGTDVRETPNGRGARFDPDGKFSGFIEPRSK
jgi:RHS repeat-associated protein